MPMPTVMLRAMRRFVLAAFALSVLTACFRSDERVADPFEPTVLPRLQLTELVQIGSGIGPTEHVLHKVSRAIVLSTGEIALANINSEILVFGVQGDLRRTSGRKGSGPGEFQFLLDIVRLDDDRILAWDPALSRVTVFGQDGRLDYMCTPQWGESAQVGGGFVGAFGDGSFVLELRSSSESRPSASDGFRRDTIPFLLFDHSGALIRSIGHFIRRQRYYSASSGYRLFLFDTSVQSRLAEGELLVGENDSIALMRFDSSGTTGPRLNLDRSPRRVTDLDIEAGWRAWEVRQTLAAEEQLGQASLTLDRRAVLAMRARVRARVEEGVATARKTIEPAEMLPAYKSIIVGSDGALWVEDYLSPTMGVSRWILMGAGFSPIGWIELQPNEQLLAAGPNSVVVLRKDQLDVESVAILGGDWPTAGSLNDM
jgi:hypothetical protein